MLLLVVENQTPISQPASQSTFQRINRKVHIYAGMFSILFIVFFGVSGFVLNHRWTLWDWFSRRVDFQELGATVFILLVWVLSKFNF